MKKLKDYFTVKIDKDSRDREWKYKIVLDYKPSLLIGIELQLTQFEGKKIDPPRPVTGRYLTLNYNIFKWEFSSHHIYYDGPNCVWNFGLISYSKTGIGHCKKCKEY
jgi:hypothetical protein